MTKRGWAAGAAIGALLALMTTAATTGPALAQAPPPVIGEPHPWQLWHQESATPVMAFMDGFHQMLFWLMVAVCILVMVLLGIVIVRFNAAKNPTPSRTAHNTLIEVIWTVVPVIILVVIAVPSFRLLYFLDRTTEAEMTLKVTGRQWYWDYEYPDHGGFTFSSIMIPEDALQPGQRRLLEVDNKVVLPVNTNIRLLFTGGDVIHAWAIPSFGNKDDAIPGRVNESWIRIDKEGTYYGQCSEICGTGHGYMPIQVEAVSKERFAEWVEGAKKQFAANPAPASTEVAARTDKE